LFDGEPQRATQQADARQRDFVESHRAIKPRLGRIGNRQ
jgi:hypothetical protein